MLVPPAEDDRAYRNISPERFLADQVSRQCWICVPGDLISFSAPFIVTLDGLVSATTVDACPKDIRGDLLPRKSKIKTSETKNTGRADAFYETFCGSSYSVVVAFLGTFREVISE